MRWGTGHFDWSPFVYLKGIGMADFWWVVGTIVFMVLVVGFGFFGFLLCIGHIRNGDK